MAWTSPPTVSPGGLISASLFGNVIRDNLNYLHSGQPVQKLVYAHTADYSTNLNTWSDVDATNLAFAMTLTTGRAIIDAHFTLGADNTSGSAALVDVIVDSTTRAGHTTYGLARVTQNSLDHVHITAVFTGLTAGSHTFKLQFRNLTAGAVTTLRAFGYPVVIVGREV
jgi:hypothetical protein